MHFGPRPKTNAAWLCSASCQLWRQRDIGAVVNIGKVFSVGFWQLPVFPTHSPSSLTFIPLGHISSTVLFIPRWWFIVLGNNSIGRQEKFCLYEQGISASSLFTAWLTPHQTRLLTYAIVITPVAPRGALFLWEDMGGTSHLSPQLPPSWSSMKVGLNLYRDVGRWQHCHCIVTHCGIGQGEGWNLSLSFFSCLLPAFFRSGYTRSLAWSCDLFCPAHCPRS